MPDTLQPSLQMPEILLIKTSSLGDVIHNLPVATDIRANFPNAVIDWVVEESFSAIPAMHSGVDEVIPVAVRRWRKNPFASRNLKEFSAFREKVSSRRYDLVIDSQGLLKSALLAKCSKGPVCGQDRHSAREGIASFLYDRKIGVDRKLHAVTRNRLLAAKCLGYSIDELPLDYGLRIPVESPERRAVFLHSTSRADKLWPEASWIELGNRLGMEIVLPWGSDAERERSLRLAAGIESASVPGRLTLREAATLISGAAIVVGVDTGLSHLAAALAAPIVGLYVSTDPGLTGILGSGRGLNLGGKEGPPPVDAVHSACLQFLGK